MEKPDTNDAIGTPISAQRKHDANLSSRKFLFDCQLEMRGHIKTQQDLPITIERSEFLQRLHDALGAVHYAYAGSDNLNNETKFPVETADTESGVAA